MERVRLSFDYSQLNATISYLTTARGIIVKYIMIAKPMKTFELLIFNDPVFNKFVYNFENETVSY